MTAVDVGIIALLILLNGVFVAAEFAVVGAPRPAIDRLARQGHRRARLVQRLLRDPREQDRAIATAQLGITLASLGLGMYGEHLLAQWIVVRLEMIGATGWAAAHGIASVMAVTVLTYFHIVLGEMVPKSLALQRARNTVLAIAPLLRLTQLAMYPLVLALNGMGNALLRLVGVRRSAGGAEQHRTLEELAIMVRESARGGLIRRENARVVSELLEFSELLAGQAMVPRVHVVGLPLGAGSAEIAKALTASPHTRYPVYQGSLDRILGMVHVKDLLSCLPECRPLSETDLHPVPHLPETARLDEVLRAMRRQGEMAVIMDEHGGTAGIVTVEDLFEEVVGEFGEDREARPEVWRDAEGRLHVSGTTRLSEVGDALGVALEHPEVDSTSGLILAQLGRPPRVGDTVEYDDVRFVVTRIEGLGIREALASTLRPLHEQRSEQGL